MGLTQSCLGGLMSGEGVGQATNGKTVISLRERRWPLA